MELLGKETGEVIWKKECKLEAIQCDCCGKIIQADSYDISMEKRKYYRVMTGHRDWGEESGDSVEFYDICPACIAKFATNYLSYDSNTAYIEIETKIAYPRHIWTVVEDEEAVD